MRDFAQAQANETQDAILEKIYPKDNGFDFQDLGAGFFAIPVLRKDHSGPPIIINNLTDSQSYSLGLLTVTQASEQMEVGTSQEQKTGIATAPSAQAGKLAISNSKIARSGSLLHFQSERSSSHLITRGGRTTNRRIKSLLPSTERSYFEERPLTAIISNQSQRVRFPSQRPENMN